MTLHKTTIVLQGSDTSGGMLDERTAWADRTRKVAIYEDGDVWMVIHLPTRANVVPYVRNSSEARSLAALVARFLPASGDPGSSPYQGMTPAQREQLRAAMTEWLPLHNYGWKTWRLRYYDEIVEEEREIGRR